MKKILLVIFTFTFFTYSSVFAEDCKDLLTAAENGDNETIQRLIDQGCDVDIISDDSFKYTPLMESIDHLNAETFKLLLENGADPNAIGGYNEAVLFIAIDTMFGPNGFYDDRVNAELIKLMIDYGANVNIKDAFGLSAIDTAIRLGRKRVAKVLKNYHGSTIIRYRTGRKTVYSVQGGTITVHPNSKPLTVKKNTKLKKKKKDWQVKLCERMNGVVEQTLPNRTSLDCLSDKYAIEIAWGKDWAEAVGKVLNYSIQTGKKPGILLRYKKKTDKEYLKKVQTLVELYKLPIMLWVAQ